MKRNGAAVIVIACLILALCVLVEALEDWLRMNVGPSLTFGTILCDWVGILALVFLVFVPLFVLLWNRLLAAELNAPRISYRQALVIFAVVQLLRI